MPDQQDRHVQLPPLDLGAVNLILEGLAQLPIARALPLFQAIEAEAQQQLQPPAPKKRARKQPEEPAP